MHGLQKTFGLMGGSGISGFAGVLEGLGLGMTWDPAEAEDAVQEAFVKLWHNRDSIDPDKIGPWLMKVTRNGCLDRLRRRRDAVEFNESHMAADMSGPLAGATASASPSASPAATSSVQRRFVMPSTRSPAL